MAGTFTLCLNNSNLTANSAVSNSNVTANPDPSLRAGTWTTCLCCAAEALLCAAVSALTPSLSAGATAEHSLKRSRWRFDRSYGLQSWPLEITVVFFNGRTVQQGTMSSDYAT
eukprot:133791-Rhodomonas_salina.1